MIKSAMGATPAGAQDEAAAAHAVRGMFNSIAPRYDLLNHLLSANIDRLWWWRTARHFRPVLQNPEASILDICCGTGDMTMALLKFRPKGARPVLAADFARAMLSRGASKFGRMGGVPIEADALQLPLRSKSQDLVVSAFGFRNLANYSEGLGEFYRVLKPGGQVGILDFSEPGGVVGKAYALYFKKVLPAVGQLLGGVGGGTSAPYQYLPTSVNKFPPPPVMLEMMAAAGYVECSWKPYTFGIAGLYTGLKARLV